VGHVQTRNRGTVGGSLCHADPAAELPTVCTALDATLTVRSANGERRVAMADWPLGYLTPSLTAEELLTEIRLPTWSPGHGWAFVEFARRHGDFAIVAVAAMLQADPQGRIERAAVALGGCCDRPVRLAAAERLLKGSAPSPEVLRQAAACASRIENVMSDAYVGADYRLHLAQVLVERALSQAVKRMEQQS